MTDTKHTPGPWTVTLEDEWPFRISIEPKVCFLNRCAFSMGDESFDDVRSAKDFEGDEHIIAGIAREEANARLIAAAPDMFEELTRLRAQNAALVEFIEKVPHRIDHISEAFWKERSGTQKLVFQEWLSGFAYEARAALAQAESGQ